jgi:hypothetical protein
MCYYRHMWSESNNSGLEYTETYRGVNSLYKLRFLEYTGIQFRVDITFLDLLMQTPLLVKIQS